MNAIEPCFWTNPGTDNPSASPYHILLDRHVRTLLAHRGGCSGRSPLVALAYWGVQHLIGDAEQAQALRQMLDELSELPGGKLDELLRQSHPSLDHGLDDMAAGLLFWLAEYAQLAD